MLELNDFLPKEDIVDIELFNQLKNKIENPCIHNIGIIGNYGAGKSSFIKSFFKWYEKESVSERFDYDASIKEARNGKMHYFHFSFTNNHGIKFCKDSSKKNKTIKINSKAHKIILNDKANVLDTNKNNLTISLGKLNSDSTKITSEDIEKCILNQIIYSVDGSELPNSRLNRIEEKESSMKLNIRKGIIFLFISLLAISIFFLFRYSDLAKYGVFKILEPTTIKEDGTKEYVKDNINEIYNLFIRGVTFFGFIISIVFSIYYFFKSRILKSILSHLKKGKISSKYIEAEISANEHDNYLNKYIDEIINFFVNTKYRILIFEDIDRFNDEDVFLHLKDLNQIVNTYFSNSGLEKITFIYSVRSDVFCNQQNDPKLTTLELVKFFDFCIPIIPYATVLNVGNMLLKFKSDNNDKKEYSTLDSEKLLLLSASIKDIRIYKNIINEYQIYCYKFKDNPLLNFQELFSLIVLKNTDFALFNKLETNSELIEDIKSFKRDLIQKILINKKQEYEAIENENSSLINYMNNEILKVQIQYLTEFYKENKDACSEHFNDAVEYFATENDIKLGELINKGKAKEWEFDYQNPDDPELIASATMNLEIFEKFEIDNMNYFEAFDNVEEKYNEAFSKVSFKRDKFQENLDKIYSSNLRELCKDYNDIYQELLNSNEDKKDLLSYILNGFITENYDKSISYFYEGQLSNNDLLFINAVKNLLETNTTELELNHINNIINELSENFGYNHIIINNQLLNYTLFIYLIENKLDKILVDYCNYINKKKRYDFIKNCLIKYTDKKELVLTYIFQKATYLFYNLSNIYEEKSRVDLYKIVLSNESFVVPRNFKNSEVQSYLSRNKKEFKDCSIHCLSNLDVLLNKMSTFK